MHATALQLSATRLIADLLNKSTRTAVATVRRAAALLLLRSIYLCLLPTAANSPHAAAAAGERWDRQTDGCSTVSWTLL